jgi:hypothetical protein
MAGARTLGQTEVISLVMITGIILALVGGAYFWGMPIIEKNSASTELAAARTMLIDINKKVISLANSGGGKVDIDLAKPVIMVSSQATDDNNSFMITYLSRQPMLSVQGGSMVYIGIANFGDMNQTGGLYGQSAPGIMTLSQNASMGGDYLITLKLRFRDLVTSGGQSKIYRIKLCDENDLTSCNNRLGGSSKLSLSFKGTQTIPGSGSPDQIVTTIGVRLS